MTLDESTYTGGTMGNDHPIAWYHEYDGGRVWYTALGHRSETFADPDFGQHLLGGILWAAGGGRGIPAVDPAGLYALAGVLMVAGATMIRRRCAC